MSEKGGRKRDVGRGATARGMVKKSRGVRAIEKEVFFC